MGETLRAHCLIKMKSQNKLKSKKIVDRLKKTYGKEIPLYLNYHKNKPYEFLFAVMMSAQCTDKRVNIVTRDLYKKYKTLKDFAAVDIFELEQDIKPVGFYHNKAINIKKTANILIEQYGGKVPKNKEDLLRLKGVGNKTANVVMGHLYNTPAMAVDTHVNRISNRLFGLNEKNPDRVEEILKEIVDKKYWVLWNTHIIAFGREICTAKNPKCENCFLSDLCNNI